MADAAVFLSIPLSLLTATIYAFLQKSTTENDRIRKSAKFKTILYFYYFKMYTIYNKKTQINTYNNILIDVQLIFFTEWHHNILFRQVIYIFYASVLCFSQFIKNGLSQQKSVICFLINDAFQIRDHKKLQLRKKYRKQLKSLKRNNVWQEMRRLVDKVR